MIILDSNRASRKEFNMNPKKLDAKYISSECSPRHIQSVIEDLVQIIKQQEELAIKVLQLNPHCNEIGAGMLANLQELAGDVIWK